MYSTVLTVIPKTKAISNKMYYGYTMAGAYQIRSSIEFKTI